MIELTVVLKDPERTYRHKNLVYEPVSLCPEDPTIQKYIHDAKLNFQGEPEDIIIKITMDIK